MGFLSSVLSIGGSIVGGAIGGPGGAAIGGQLGGAAGGYIEGSGANARSRDAIVAAQDTAYHRQVQAQQLAQQRFDEQVQKAINEVGARDAEAAALYQPILGRSPANMTPSQRIEHEDLLRGNRAILASSGLRGAGRAGVASIMDIDRRFLANAYDRNQSRQDAARSYLANLASSRGRTIGSYLTSMGENAARSERAIGEAGAQSAVNSGEVQSDYQLAQSKLAGSTADTLGKMFLDSTQGKYGGGRTYTNEGYIDWFPRG